MLKEANRVSLGAVHTHTHTSTFRKIKRVANRATLFGVKNRLCVGLCLGKDVVLEIACFSCCLKINFITELTNLKLLNKLEIQGGVA